MTSRWVVNKRGIKINSKNWKSFVTVILTLIFDKLLSLLALTLQSGRNMLTMTVYIFTAFSE